MIWSSTVINGWTDNPILCPVLQWVCLVNQIWTYLGTTEDNSACTVWRHDRCELITSRQVIVTLWSACANIGRSPWLWAQQNWHSLPLLWCCNGNVPSRGTSVHHHAHWQIVKWHISVLYLKAGWAVLIRCCKENADASNDPRRQPCVASNEDPRQRNHCDNAKTRRNIGRDVSWRVQLLAFSLFNWLIKDAEASINGGGVIFSIAEGVGGGGDWINNSVPNPNPLCTSCAHLL